MSLARQGVAFAESQLAKGLTLFCGLISPSFSLPTNVDGIDFDIHSTSEISDDEPVPDKEIENFYEEMDFDLILSTGYDLMGQLDLTDCHQLCLDDVVECLFLPSEFSQGSISGRNGSNACSLIALLLGFSTTHLPMQGVREICLRQIMPIFIGCMEIGNLLYEVQQNSNLLTIVDAVSLIPDHIKLTISDETNSFLGEESGVCFKDVLTEFKGSVKERQFLTLVSGHETRSLVKIGSDLFVFDSHSHPPYGASIHMVPFVNCEAFLKLSLGYKDKLLPIYSCVITVEE